MTKAEIEQLENELKIRELKIRIQELDNKIEERLEQGKNRAVASNLMLPATNEGAAPIPELEPLIQEPPKKQGIFNKFVGKKVQKCPKCGTIMLPEGVEDFLREEIQRITQELKC